MTYNYSVYILDIVLSHKNSADHKIAIKICPSWKVVAAEVSLGEEQTCLVSRIQCQVK